MVYKVENAFTEWDTELLEIWIGTELNKVSDARAFTLVEIQEMKRELSSRVKL